MSIRGIMSGGNGQSWGNIFQVNTPYIDQLGKQIYNQEQQRQLNQQRESDALDNQFSKEVANIRDTDVNEYADKYNDWKQAKIGLMKMNPNNNSKEYIQAQMDANRKLAAMSQFGNESIQNKAELKSITGEYGKDTKGVFKPDAGNMISKANGLPSSQWNTLGYDPTNLESYKNQANPDKWTKILNTAMGVGKTPIKAEYDEPMDKSEGIGTVHKTITGLSSPAQVSQNLTTESVNNPGEFIRTYESQFPPERVAQITQDYNDKIVNNPDAVKLWGNNGVKLPINGVLTEQQALANTIAMNYALEHQPNVTAVKNDYNKVGVMNKQEAFQQAQQARQNQYTIGHIKLAAGLRNDLKSNDAAQSADAVLHDMYDNINVGEQANNNLAKGTPLEGMGNNLPIPVSDPNLLKTFSNIKKDGSTPIPPNDVTFDKTKDQYNLNYKMSDETTQTIPVSGRDAAKLKIKETYPNKDIGQVNNIVDKLISKNGGLYNTLQMYNPSNQNTTTPPVSNSQVKVQIGNKIYQVPKSNLPKMDKDKVQYKVIQ